MRPKCSQVRALPSRQTTFLGLLLDTEAGRATLSRERWADLESSLAPFLHEGARVTYHTVSKLLDLLCAAHQVVPLGLLNLRLLQGWFSRLHAAYGRDRRFNNMIVTVPKEVLPDLAHWTKAASDKVGMPLGPKDPVVTLCTDACNTGWGAILGHQTVKGVWTEYRHIRDRETEAIWLALQHFAPALRGRHVLVLTDSMTAKAVINHQGDLRSEFRMDLARRAWRWAAQNVMSLTAEYIPGKYNVATDILSRGGPHDDEWSLSPIIVGMIWERFGRAQVDLFARRCNRKCPLWYSQNPTELAPLGTNAFGPDPWPRKLLYAFPPPVLLLDVIARFEKEGGNLILVAPMNEASTWFPRMCPLIQGQRMDLPMWEDALTQAGGQLRSLPRLGMRNLAAWMLSVPGT